MLKKILLSIITVAAIGLTASVLRTDHATADPAPGVITFSDAQAFGEFRIFYAGDTVLDLDMTYVLMQPISQEAEYWQAGDPTRNTVSFIYGDCPRADEGGCAPPLEVQNWPACVRNPSWYSTQQYGPAPESATIRTVPAAFFEEGTRVEIQTGISTVVIFGPSQSDVLAVANALRAVNSSTPDQPGEPLPAPAPGSFDGTLAC